MKIVLVGPGIMPIPPTGWGAVEILVWDTKNALEELGHEVYIINTKDYRQIINGINAFVPDFVHVHYDEFIPIMPYIQYPSAITSHFGYLERKEMFGGYASVAGEFQKIKPNVFCLSEGIEKVYNIMFDIPKENTFVTPNGVNVDRFRVSEDPLHSDRSIYLARLTIVNVNIYSKELIVFGLLVILQIIGLILIKIISGSGIRRLYIMS